MQHQKTATLTTIFSDVLANLAFMFNDDEPGESTGGEVWIETTISYRGSESGTLRLRCPTEFAALLAANLLGIERDDPDVDTKAEDAVKEFMNIVCGQLITTWYGAEHVFDLTIPQTQVLMETPTFSEPDDISVTTLAVEGHQVQLLHTTPRVTADIA
ncbi:MAG: chemotaxis protein CheX [Phycisphaerales bacterium]|nr:chemotaxis protein CheX [Phycisphaerales bacterium]